MIRIFEVGPRDGLQNEPVIFTLDQKLQLIEALLKSGLQDIEVGAFVRPDRIPQMADTDQLYRNSGFQRLREQFPHSRMWALVPNEQGLTRAMDAGAKQIAVFGGATESFVQKNIGMSIKESLEVFSRVVKKAFREGMEVRGYVSVCWVCPYEGEVAQEKVIPVVQSMLDFGIPQISLGDTIGRAHPAATEELLTQLLSIAPAERFAVHFHDTYGMALANIDRSVNLGITTIDSSVGGLGGCPYAAGATGNVATEDVLTILDGYRKRGRQVVHLIESEIMNAAVLAHRLAGRALPSRRLAAHLAQLARTQ